MRTQPRLLRSAAQTAALTLLAGSMWAFGGVAASGASGPSLAADEDPASVGGPAPAASASPRALAAGADLCARVGGNTGWTHDELVTAVAIGLAESGCNPNATGHNSGGSVDRGLWQINSYWHPEVSDACAYDAQCNANAAYDISSGGADWTPWTTYNSGAYVQYLDEARAAVGGGGGGGTGCTADGPVVTDYEGDSYPTRYCDNYKSGYVMTRSGQRSGFLNAGTNWFVCQQKFAGWENPAVGGAHNDYWLYTQGDRTADTTAYDGWGWFPATYVSGGGNYEAVPGLPACSDVW